LFKFVGFSQGKTIVEVSRKPCWLEIIPTCSVDRPFAAMI